MNKYEQQAQNFLIETETEFKTEFIGNNKYFDDDKQTRDIYLITLKRGNREYKFKFGNSLNNSGKFKIFASDGFKLTNDEKEALKYKKKTAHVKRNNDFKEPSAYDVLACLTKSEVGTFKDFCGEFGYNEDSIKAEKMYNAVIDEWENIKMLYSDEEILKLQEIN
jgi:hypothetical protein